MEKWGAVDHVYIPIVQGRLLVTFVSDCNYLELISPTFGNKGMITFCLQEEV